MWSKVAFLEYVTGRAEAFRAGKRGDMNRPAITEHHHIGKAVQFKLCGEPFGQCRHVIAKPPCVARQPESGIAAIEIYLEYRMARCEQLVGEPGEKWAAYALQEEETFGHFRVSGCVENGTWQACRQEIGLKRPVNVFGAHTRTHTLPHLEQVGPSVLFDAEAVAFARGKYRADVVGSIPPPIA